MSTYVGHKVSNKLKIEICSARKSFMQNALSSYQPRDVWKIVPRILKNQTVSLYEST